MIRVCPNCGTKNRIPAKHLADTGRCGACTSPLPPVAEPIEATPEIFKDIVEHATVPILVDFWAPWCGPCKIAAPEIRELAREMAGRALVLKVDTDQYPEIAAPYNIQAIPTFIVFRDGQVAFRRSGVAPRTEMRRWIELVPQSK
jgi:thioredoxin 2